MALVKCKECGQKVSSKAKACPACGAKPPKKTSFVTWGVVAIMALVVYGTMQQTPSPSSNDTTQNLSAAEKEQRTKERRAASERRNNEIAWTIRGKNAVKEILKDPDSAEFKDVYFSRGSDDVPMTCGQVNSKNSFGGFVGFQHFISAGDADNTYLENQVEGFATIWNKFCTK